MTTKWERVATALAEDPDRSDRLIARTCGVSHPYVGKVRRKLRTRTLKDVRTFFEEMGKPYQIDGVQAMGRLMLRFIDGVIPDEVLMDRLDRLLVLADPADCQ